MIAGYKEKVKLYFVHGNRGRTPVHALSENFDEISETKSKRIYILPMSHPWKQSLFDNFIQLQEHWLEKVS